jgi:hypothetical protein
MRFVLVETKAPRGYVVAHVRAPWIGPWGGRVVAEGTREACETAKRLMEMT